MTTWSPPQAHDTLDATVRLPGSKSLTNRYLILAALASGPSRLRRPLRSRDTDLMADALRALGIEIDEEGEGDWIVRPAPMRGPATVDCGLAGTVMRFLPAAAVLGTGPITFDGDEQAYRRPLAPLTSALTSLGASIELNPDNPSGLPFTIDGAGSLPGGTVEVDASTSSQFVSALLLSGSQYDEGVTINHTGGALPSQPHIEMTLEVLRDAGADVDESEPNTWRVEPGPLRPLDVAVEPDLSNAAPFLAAALVTGGTVRVPGWPTHTTQAGDAIRAVLLPMGGSIDLGRDGIAVTGTGKVAPIDVDLRAASELTPVVAALAALADGRSVIRGVAHIRHHETNRLAALATELTKLGGVVTETEDGLIIDGAPLHGGTFETYGDHRMVMAAAVLGLRVPHLEVIDPGTVAKTLPEFVPMWDAMLKT